MSPTPHGSLTFTWENNSLILTRVPQWPRASRRDRVNIVLLAEVIRGPHTRLSIDSDFCEY